MKPKLVMILCLLRSNASAFATPSRARGVGVKVIKSNRRNLLPSIKRTAVTLVDDDDDTDNYNSETSTSLHATSQQSSYYNTQQSQPQLLSSGHIAFRLARRTDVQQIQNCNLATLPENYNANFYINHMRSWPELTLVAEHIPEGYDLELENSNRDDSTRITPLRDYMRTKQQQNRDIDRPQKEIVGYILGKVEERPLNPQRRIFPNNNSQQQNVPLYNNNYYDEEETLLQYMNNGNGNNGVRFPSSRRGGRGRPPRPPTEKIGHITSLAVHNHARRLGIAKSLLHQLHYHLQECYDSTSIGLHVRISNKAAVQLYIDEGYDVADIIPMYYGDGEDAYFMRKDFDTVVSEEIPSKSAEPKQWRRGERERNEMLNRDASSGSFFDGRSSMRDTLTEEERAWVNTNPQQASPVNNMATRSQSTLSGQFKRGFRTFFNGGEQMQVRRQVNQWSKPCWEVGPEGLRLPRYARVMRSIPSPETQVTDSAPNGKNFSLKDLVSNQDEENDRYDDEEEVDGSDVAMNIRVASGPIL